MDTTSIRLAVIAELTKASRNPEYAGRTLSDTAHALCIATLNRFPNDVPEEAISIGQVVLQYLDDHIEHAGNDDVSLKRLHKRLSPIQRRALQLHHEEGLTYKEVATRLRISNEHALSLLTKAIARVADSADKANQLRAILRGLDAVAAALISDVSAEQTLVNAVTQLCFQDTSKDS